MIKKIISMGLMIIIILSIVVSGQMYCEPRKEDGNCTLVSNTPEVINDYNWAFELIKKYLQVPLFEELTIKILELGMTENVITKSESDIEILKTENALLKSELCKKDNTYIWCVEDVITT